MILTLLPGGHNGPAFDTSWYLAINRWARASTWAHAFMTPYAVWGGVTILVPLPAWA